MGTSCGTCLNGGLWDFQGTPADGDFPSTRGVVEEVPTQTVKHSQFTPGALNLMDARRSEGNTRVCREGARCGDARWGRGRNAGSSRALKLVADDKQKFGKDKEENDEEGMVDCSGE